MSQGQLDSATAMSMDAITFGMFWDRLISVSEEQVAMLMRTSFSPLVREAGDLAAGIFDSRGRMVCQPLTGTPGHINPLSVTVKLFLEKFPAEELKPGDVLITNDPWLATGHLMDVTLATPVFDPEGESLVGIIACSCHMVDMGGRGPGAGGNDMYEEGVLIPIMKLRDGGKNNESLLEMMRANNRNPLHFFGDLWAMVASCVVTSEKLQRLLADYELSCVDDVADEILNRSEEAQRKAIEALPDGRFEHRTTFDGFDEPIELVCTLTKAGSDILLDFDGSSPETKAGINVVLNYTAGYSTYAVRSALAPEVPNNDGSMAPIKVVAPEGSILNCRRGSPTMARHLVGQFVVCPVLGALGNLVPDRVLAEGASAIWALGVRIRDGNNFDSMFVTFSGGLGARAASDGLSATSFPGLLADIPVEVYETSLPVTVHRKQLRVDSGGPGRSRGGLAPEVEVSFRGENDAIVSFMLDRIESPAQGYMGGRPGACGATAYSDGRELPGKGTVIIKPDDPFTLSLPGGGGYGDPATRPVAAVLADLRDGFISKEACFRDYSVVIDEHGEVDQEATEKLRRERVGV